MIFWWTPIKLFKDHVLNNAHKWSHLGRYDKRNTLLHWFHGDLFTFMSHKDVTLTQQWWCLQTTNLILQNNKIWSSALFCKHHQWCHASAEQYHGLSYTWIELLQSDIKNIWALSDWQSSRELCTIIAWLYRGILRHDIVWHHGVKTWRCGTS